MKHFLLFLGILCSFTSFAQEPSIARQWNDEMLFSFYRDRARPTVQTRQSFHVNAAIYDAWAAYHQPDLTYFLGKTVGDFSTPFEGVEIPETEEELDSAVEEAISYAAYRLMAHYFENLPANNEIEVQDSLLSKMNELGYSVDVISTDYVNNGPAALGNHIAESIIAFGLQDGSNEADNYENQYYENLNQVFSMPFNLPLYGYGTTVNYPTGDSTMTNPDNFQRIVPVWQTDQTVWPALPIPNFLTPEWGNVQPFALTDEDKHVLEREGNIYNLYCDQGAPPLLDQTTPQNGLDDPIKEAHAMVLTYSALLNPDDGTVIDISPNTLGNNPEAFPSELGESNIDFYGFFDGSDLSQGYETNPVTGEAYTLQTVNRATYFRTITEQWKLFEENPMPNYWYNIMNTVSDHPDFEKRWKGQGEIVSDLEWDVKSYFGLSATLHDCAIATWSHKGYYDAPSPTNRMRYMASLGQSTDSLAPNYSPSGLPLIPGYIELIEANDPLVGVSQEHLHELKVNTWRGHDFLDHIGTQAYVNIGEIIDGIQDSTSAGVGWILAENWDTYQRPFFITPPFASYVSDYASLSRAAAEFLTSATGSEYFPGGLMEFSTEGMDTYVEASPIDPITLQYVSYRDMADQIALAQIIGGISTPIDDIPGRILGKKVAEKAFIKVCNTVDSNPPSVVSVTANTDLLNDDFAGTDLTITVTYSTAMDQTIDPELTFSLDLSGSLPSVSQEWTSDSTFQWSFSTVDGNDEFLEFSLDITGGTGLTSEIHPPYSIESPFIIDTVNPLFTEFTMEPSTINEALAGETIEMTFMFSEPMSPTSLDISFLSGGETVEAVSGTATTEWTADSVYTLSTQAIDANEELDFVSASISSITDAHGNPTINPALSALTTIDTRAPEVIAMANTYDITTVNSGENGFEISLIFDEPMDQSVTPVISFPVEDPSASISLNLDGSGWLGSTYNASFDVNSELTPLPFIDIEVSNAQDSQGNPLSLITFVDFFSIDLETYLSVATLTQTELTLSPNPIRVGENLTISDADKGISKIEVFNTQGAVFYSESTKEPTDFIKIPTAGLAAGSYFVRVSYSDKHAIYKLQVLD